MCGTGQLHHTQRRQQAVLVQKLHVCHVLNHASVQQVFKGANVFVAAHPRMPFPTKLFGARVAQPRCSIRRRHKE